MKQYKVTFYKHSCFQVEDEHNIFLFDWFDDTVPVLDEHKQIYILNSHKHGDHYHPCLLQLVDQDPCITFLLSKEIRMPKEDSRFIPVKHSTIYNLPGKIPLQIETLRSTDIGVAFLVHYDNTVIYHAGDLNWWSWSGESASWNHNMEVKFQQSMQHLENLPVHIAFIPLDPRQEERFCWGLNYFLQHSKAETVFPMHMWGKLDTVAKWRSQTKNEQWQRIVKDVEREGQQFVVTVS